MELRMRSAVQVRQAALKRIKQRLIEVKRLGKPLF